MSAAWTSVPIRMFGVMFVLWWLASPRVAWCGTPACLTIQGPTPLELEGTVSVGYVHVDLNAEWTGYKPIPAYTMTLDTPVRIRASVDDPCPERAETVFYLLGQLASYTPRAASGNRIRVVVQTVPGHGDLPSRRWYHPVCLVRQDTCTPLVQQ